MQATIIFMYFSRNDEGRLYSSNITRIVKYNLNLNWYFSRNDAGDYNLQCNVDSKPRSLSPKRPFYCQFIPFFDTKKRWQTTTTSTTTTTTTTSIRDKEWLWRKLNSSTVHTVNYFIFPLTYEKWRDIHNIIDEEEEKPKLKVTVYKLDSYIYSQS